jgi:nitroimidazol reductase NimA-like FMN-containing flavoprotein (pyridoxamine 5'-phosphate oxidase superfamily)
MGIELTPEEITAYLQSAPRCILCVSRPGQAPLPLPMWFAWMDGKLFMHTLSSSKKLKHIRAQPEVSCLVESGEQYFSLKALLIIGHCELIDDQAEVQRARERMDESKPLYKQLRPETWPPHLERLYQQPRTLVRITPRSITSWDFAKIKR